MGYEERATSSIGFRGCLISVLVVVSALLICGGSLFAFYDVRCSQDASRWIPIYPGSEIVTQQYSSWRPFGAGVTFVRLHSDDDVEAVREFYVETQRALRQQDIGLMQARINYVVEADSEGGTTIDLLSQCNIGW